MDINTESLLKMDFDTWKDAGLGDAAFKELENLPGVPVKGAVTGEAQPDAFIARPIRNIAPPSRIEKLVASWPQEKEYDQPSGPPLLREVRFLRAEERTLVQKSSLIKQYTQAGERMQALNDSAILGDLHTSSDLTEVANSLLSLLISDPFATLALTLGRGNSLSEYQSRHAVNTALLSMAIATASGFSRLQVIDIGIGGLIADLGMLLVPEAILNKVGKLAAEELAEIHCHSQQGAELLEKLNGLPPVALTILLQHHERLSGAGYPRHLKGPAISHAARVVAIGDTLAAMVHKRSHRDAMLPQEALDRVIKMGQMQFLESAYIRYLAGWLSIYPIGSGVLLQSGRIGRVTAANLEDFNRPVVAVIKSADGQVFSMKQVVQIDLRTTPSEKIARGLDDSETGIKGLDGF